MVKRAVAILVLGSSLLAFRIAWAQKEKETPKACVILKRMGPADQVTSHLYSFGIRGKQFQYLEGELPKGVKFHGRLTDHDVREIQDNGGKVVVVDAHYTDQELADARKSCASGASAPQGNPPPTGLSGPAPDSPTAAPKSGETPSADEVLATVALSSTPVGADITVDGKYVGSTPSTIKLKAGDHDIKIEKSGFKAWQRTMTVEAGSSAKIEATLDKAE